MKDLDRLVAEANECAKLMKKRIYFTTQLFGVIPENFSNNRPLDDLKNRRDEIKVKVEDLENGSVYIWTVDKFKDKLDMMRDVVNTFTETGEVPQMEPDDDPFYDEIQPLLIGQGYYKLEPLAYLIDNPAVISIIGTTS